MTLPLTLWGYRPGACGVKKRERDIAADVSAAVDDLVRTIRRKEAEFTMAGKERVKVGVAWAVRLSVTVGETLWADGCSHYSTNSRDDRALFSSRERAKDVLRHWSRVVSEVETSARPDAPRIVRVTFYEVQREKA